MCEQGPKKHQKLNVSEKLGDSKASRYLKETDKIHLEDKESLYCIQQVRLTVEASPMLTLQTILDQEVDEAEALCLPPVLPQPASIIEVRG